jgi:hypothetical protein
MRRAVLAVGLGLLVVAALVWAVPFLSREQEYAATTPQPDPLFVTSSIPLDGGARACTEGAVLDPRSEVARVRASTPGPRAMPLELTLRGGDGYSATARIAPTYADHQSVAIPVQPPREAVATTICIRNRGRQEVELAASDDRTNARRPTEVDGAPVPQNFVIVFSEREPRSIAERLPVSLERASAFRPVSPGLLWPLLALFVFGVPLGVLWAYGYAASDQDDAERA